MPIVIPMSRWIAPSPRFLKWRFETLLRCSSETNRRIVSGSQERWADGRGVPSWVVGPAPKLRYLVDAGDVVDSELRRAGGCRADSEFLNAVAKRVGMQVQDLRGAVRALDFSGTLVKSREDMVSLDLVQGRQFSHACGSDCVTLRTGRVVVRGFRTRHRNQVAVQAKNGFRRNNHRTLNHILQLANVPWPGVIQKVVHRFP